MLKWLNSNAAKLFEIPDPTTVEGLYEGRLLSHQIREADVNGQTMVELLPVNLGRWMNPISEKVVGKIAEGAFETALVAGTAGEAAAVLPAVRLGRTARYAELGSMGSLESIELTSLNRSTSSLSSSSSVRTGSFGDLRAIKRARSSEGSLPNLKRVRSSTMTDFDIYGFD